MLGDGNLDDNFLVDTSDDLYGHCMDEAREALGSSFLDSNQVKIFLVSGLVVAGLVVKLVASTHSAWARTLRQTVLY